MRQAQGGDQTFAADVLTALGEPTRAATVARVERGEQPPTLEQALLLALLHNRGLEELLTLPVRVGRIVVETPAELRQLLLGPLGPGAQQDEKPGPWFVAGDLAHEALRDRRRRQVAAELRVPVEQVREAELALYGDQPGARTIASQVTARLIYRRDQHLADGFEKPSEATRRAWQSHALRAVTREIRTYLEEQQ